MNPILEATGRVIEKYDAKHINDRLTKREFILETRDEYDGKEYINYVKFQLANQRCGLIDGLPPGQTVRVAFNLRGSRYEKDGQVKYITNLDVYKLERL